MSVESTARSEVTQSISNGRRHPYRVRGRTSGQTKGPPIDIRAVLLVAYLTSLVFEGPVRMVLTFAKLETALYIRDVFAFGTILWVAFKGRPGGGRFMNPTAWILYAMVCHSLLSLWLGHPLGSILFGFKLFMSLMFGVACSDLLLKHEKWVVRLVLIFLVASAVGVFVNAVVGQYPWEGEDFDSAFGSNKNSYIWWAGGERRLPGFARLSFSAAAIIGICGSFAVTYFERYWMKIAVVGVVLPAIYLTTSKGVILSYVLVAAIGFMPQGGAKIKSGLLLFWIFVVSAILAPFVATYFDLNPDLVRTALPSLSSFADRAAVTWPGVIEDLSHWYTLIIGQGVGGIGGALRFGNEFHRFVPVDNMFLYCYGIFGMLGFLYYMLGMLQLRALSRENGRFGYALFSVGVLLIGYGITANQFEDAFIGITLGLLFGAYQRTRIGDVGTLPHEATRVKHK